MHPTRASRRFEAVVLACCAVALAFAAADPTIAARTSAGPAQHTLAPSAAGTTDQQNAPVTTTSFSASGLRNEDTFIRIFRGDFASVEFARDDPQFAILFQEYLNAYARACSAYLPPDKIEMTRRECGSELVTRNGFGVELGRSCTGYVTVGTGLYADPGLYAAKGELERLFTADALLRTIAQTDPIAGAMSLVGASEIATNDTAALLRMNACAGPGLRRFQENLRRFALHGSPVQLAGGTPSQPDSPAVTAQDQDYTRLVEDLIADQAKSWALNRLVPGSVREVAVKSTDAAGRPVRIVAGYSYSGFYGPSQGTVTIHFANGEPDCLYFFDAPAACRSPGGRIVAAYTAGSYRR